MEALRIYIFLLLTFGHFVSIPLWLKRFIWNKFTSLEEYVFYASFFSVTSFYIILHSIALLGGLSLWKVGIVIGIFNLLLWKIRKTYFCHNNISPNFKVEKIDWICLILVATITLQWINTAYQNDIIAGIDAAHYHVPHMANFSNGEPLFGLLPTPHLYPMSHNLLGGWFFLCFNSPLIVDWLNILPFLLIFASFSLLFKLLTNRSGFILALLALFTLFSSNLLDLAEKISSDLSYGSSYIVLFTILTSAVMKNKFGEFEWLALSLASGLLIGTKTIGLPILLTTIAIFFILIKIGFFIVEIEKPKLNYLPLYIFLFIFAGGIWLIRNWYLYGSPIAPLGLTVFGVEIFEGEKHEAMKYYLSVFKDIRDIPNYQFYKHLITIINKWYGNYYIYLFGFTSLLILDSILLVFFHGRTLINEQRTLKIKYGLLILFFLTVIINGYLFMGAPWSSLHFSGGMNIRFILPSIICSYPLFLSLAIPYKSNHNFNNYFLWIVILFFIVINVYVYKIYPNNTNGFVQYPSLIWILLAILIVLYIYYSNRFLTYWVSLLLGILLLFVLFYGDIQQKSFQAFRRAELSYINGFENYKLNKSVKNKYFQYKELLFGINKLGLSCKKNRFFLLSRFDFPLLLQQPYYKSHIVDLHTPHLQKSAKKLALLFDADKYCEFLVCFKKDASIYAIKQKIVSYIPNDTLILKELFKGSTYSLYQILNSRNNVVLSSLSGTKKILNDGTLIKPWGGKLTSIKYYFPEGENAIEIVAKGTEVRGVNCQLKVYLGKKLLGEFYLKEQYQTIPIFFKNSTSKVESIIIDFTNDANDPKRKEDRNFFLKSITIKRN